MAYRLLIVYDVRGWAYERRAQALQKYAPEDFEVDTAPIKELRSVSGYDLIFNLEYANPTRFNGADCPVAISYNSDHNRRQHYWSAAYQNADMLICNNQHVFDARGRPEKTCCISNGVDLDLFEDRVPIEDRPHRVFWCGSTGPRKGKGYQDVLLPLQKVLGDEFDCLFRPIDKIDERVLATEPLVQQYNSCSYVICASVSEGTPNYVTEAVACGCVAVSVPVGNILEWGEDGVNCVIRDRSVESLAEGLRHAKGFRGQLQGIEEMRDWCYSKRAGYYFAVFRRMIHQQRIEPFSYRDCEPEDI